MTILGGLINLSSHAVSSNTFHGIKHDAPLL